MSSVFAASVLSESFGWVSSCGLGLLLLQLLALSLRAKRGSSERRTQVITLLYTGPSPHCRGVPAHQSLLQGGVLAHLQLCLRGSPHTTGATWELEVASRTLSRSPNTPVVSDTGCFAPEPKAAAEENNSVLARAVQWGSAQPPPSHGGPCMIAVITWGSLQADIIVQGSTCTGRPIARGSPHPRAPAAPGALRNPHRRTGALHSPPRRWGRPAHARPGPETTTPGVPRAGGPTERRADWLRRMFKRGARRRPHPGGGGAAGVCGVAVSRAVRLGPAGTGGAAGRGGL